MAVKRRKEPAVTEDMIYVPPEEVQVPAEEMTEPAEPIHEEVTEPIAEPVTEGAEMQEAAPECPVEYISYTYDVMGIDQVTVKVPKDTHRWDPAKIAVMSDAAKNAYLRTYAESVMRGGKGRGRPSIIRYQGPGGTRSIITEIDPEIFAEGWKMFRGAVSPDAFINAIYSAAGAALPMIHTDMRTVELD